MTVRVKIRPVYDPRPRSKKARRLGKRRAAKAFARLLLEHPSAIGTPRWGRILHGLAWGM